MLTFLTATGPFLAGVCVGVIVSMLLVLLVYYRGE